MSLNHFVDAAVDKAAKAAKMKVKSMLGGGAGGTSKQPNNSGGMGGLFPSAGDSGDGKPKKGGLFGGLLSTQQDNMHPGAGGSAGGNAGGSAAGSAGGNAAESAAGNQDFNSAVDELAGF